MCLKGEKMKKRFKTLWKRLLACILVLTIVLSSFDVKALATAVENTEHTATEETDMSTEETGTVTGTTEGTTAHEQTDNTVPEDGTSASEGGETTLP